MKAQVNEVAKEEGNRKTAYEMAEPTKDVSLWQLLQSFFWVGIISFGGKGAPFLFDELVRRRGWLTSEDYAEAFTLAKLLPGPTAQSTAIFMLQRWNNIAVTLLCLFIYMVPGIVIMFLLILLLIEIKLPAWAQGGIAGLALAATALLLSMAFKMASSALRAHYGLVLSIATFVGTCVLGADLLLTLLVLVPCALALNRPSEMLRHV